MFIPPHINDVYQLIDHITNNIPEHGDIVSKLSQMPKYRSTMIRINIDNVVDFHRGYVHPKSIATLKRHGVDPGSPRSKSWDEFSGQAFDLVVTVCDAAAAESCPVFLGPVKKIHWSTPDPAKATGTDSEIEVAFDEAFYMLKERIEDYLK